MAVAKPDITNEHCGFCDADLRGAPIPQEHIDAGYYRPGVTHYSQLIGIEYAYDHPDHYDGVSEDMCPRCETRVGCWSRRKLEPGESEPRWGGKP